MRKLMLLSSYFFTNANSLPDSLSPFPSPSPSPSPYADPPLPPNRPIFVFPTIPIADSGFDLAVVFVVGSIILLSLLSFSLVLHLRIRCRQWWHLQHFNYLWAVRLLLITWASLWAVNELLRLPSLRRDYLYPFLPSLTLNQQADLCKIHVVLSLGFFEPGFLVTLLFLVNVSIKKRLPQRLWALMTSVCISCSPMLILQTIFVYYSPLEKRSPKLLHGSSILLKDIYGKKTMLCTYPFFSFVIFGAFAIVYSLAFMLSCWKVVELVINKSIRARINLLVSTLMLTLPLQILGLALSFLWNPDDVAYCVLTLGMFLSVAWLMTIGEVILVIKPITESLAAGSDVCREGGH